MKCAAANCYHVEDSFDEMIIANKKRYHTDCYQAIQNIKKIIDIWYRQVNKFVNFAELRRIINEIVYTRKVDSEFLLFGLEYFVDNHRKLNYPSGLYYVIQSREVQNAYERKKQTQNKLEFKLADEGLRGENNETIVSYEIPKKKGIADIIR